MSPALWRAWLCEEAENTIREAACRSDPDEAGGVLVGVLVGRRPWVTEAIEVPSIHPSGNRYEISGEDRVKAVSRARDADARLGYLGEWHSHPADVGPSSTDLGEMKLRGGSERPL